MDPEEEVNKQKVISNLSHVTENTTNLDKLLNLVVEREILQLEEREDIAAERTSYKQKTQLYITVVKKGEEAIERFFKCLKDSGNEEIYNRLTGVISITNTNNFSQCICFETEKATKYFVGREEAILKIHKWHQDSLQDDYLSFVSITGLGGIGKSELAKNFAKYFLETLKGHVIWINGQSRESAMGSFVRLAKRLEIGLKDYEGNQKGLKDLADEVYKTMGCKGDSCLYVFDNVENYEEPFIVALAETWRFLEPSMSRTPFVLLTSRYAPAKKFLGYYTQQLELIVLTSEYAQTFVVRALGVRKEEELPIKELCERLKNYPLALQQAVSHINAQERYSSIRLALIAYLKKLEEEAKAVLEIKLPYLQTLGNISDTTYLTWKLTLQKIAAVDGVGPMAIDVMNTMAFLSPENISTALVAQMTATNAKVFEVLDDYSMVKLNTSDGNTTKIWIHRLVQEMSRINLEENRKFIKTLDKLLTTVQQLIDRDDVVAELLDNMSSIWGHASRHPFLVKKYKLLYDVLKESPKYPDIILDTY